jgi:hypothetical protein
MEAKTCLNCGDVLKGRIDKKFCDDQCRTQFNNRLNSDSSAVVKTINHILKKNRRIMEELLSHAADGKAKATGKKLQEKGFNTSYHTHTYKTKAGAVYYFCYEYGYLPLDNDYYMVVKKQDYS